MTNRYETISNIGSVTKQFTAMGLLLLQAEGKLSLEDDIRDHIPELPDFGVRITLRNLLNHTGGYREVYNLMPMTGYQGEDALSRDKVIQIVQRQPELQAMPNTEYNYNNTGYILLATTIERVTEMTFPEYMKANVFAPLGMTNTRVKGYQGEVIPGSAQGYVPVEGGGYRTARDLAASYGAGGIYTTVDDLARWMLNYRDKRLGGPDAIGAITTNINATPRNRPCLCRCSEQCRRLRTRMRIDRASQCGRPSSGPNDRPERCGADHRSGREGVTAAADPCPR